MPLLQVDTTRSLSSAETESFADRVRGLYAAEMRTGTSHVAVTVRCHESAALSLGRSVPGDHFFLDAAVRRGRDEETKRAFALAAMDAARDALGVPRPNMKVVFTEHDGPNMMGYDRVGDAWTPEES